jgi:integrative and conjugative element protein (TIGR02256 family)
MLAQASRLSDLWARHAVIVYPIGRSGQRLSFMPEVLKQLARHQQTRFWHREAGGQLFARIEDCNVRVVEATGPRPTDRRCRSRYEPDRVAEQAEIDARFPQGLHFVGDWHTHPEDRPTPSSIDLLSTAEGVRRSRHGLNAFVLVIVGRGAFPAGLHVCLHDAVTQYELRASS